MLRHCQPAPASRRPREGKFTLLLIIVVFVSMVGVVSLGGRASLEEFLTHRAEIDMFVREHIVAAIGCFAVVYIASVALSMPGALFLTIAAGVLFGWLIGALVGLLSATIGAAIIMIIARRTFANLGLLGRSRLARKLAAGFDAGGVYYLLFLRVVPLFPFWLVNLAIAWFGVRLDLFIITTMVGIAPLMFFFASLGAGLDDMITARIADYGACQKRGSPDCRLDFDWTAILTPQFVVALTCLGIFVLVPALLKSFRRLRSE